VKKAQHHQAHGHARKHTAHKKHIHHARNKHHPAHQKAAHHAHKAGHVSTVGHHPKRHLSLGEVACCAAEALASSLRLTGAPVGEDDVLALYWRTASAPGDGASLLDTLRAAQEHGLAGWRPTWQMAGNNIFRPGLPPLIIGLDLPGGSHALTLDACGCCAWSWGGLYRFADLQPGPVEEAWAVSWR
jgi:hypothetical protein